MTAAEQSTIELAKMLVPRIVKRGLISKPTNLILNWFIYLASKYINMSGVSKQNLKKFPNRRRPEPLNHSDKDFLDDCVGIQILNGVLKFFRAGGNFYW
jgi:hypothetical protein